MAVDPAIGQGGRQLGRYTLVRSLGTGGMAELYLARAEGPGGFAKLVALKRILPHRATNERFVRMLLNEARLVASLDHPNIAAVYDIGLEDNEYFFAMEYVHGQDLRRVLHAASGGTLRLENVLHIAIGICAGLHHAHEARDPSGAPLDIVHRDVSPPNVLVSYQGSIKLVDFGVAKAATVVSETREGVIKGKHGYMSPEQCLGEKLDRRSDLFAVGILLWEMTVGRRLYKVNGELATLQRIVYADAPRPSKFVDGYPPELERIVIRALTRDVSQRYQTAEEFQLDLEAFALAYRLPVSAVAMTQQMAELFRHRIDAWREAEQAGRSLADHLAELSSEDSGPDSSDDGEGTSRDSIAKAFGAIPRRTDAVDTMPAKSLVARAASMGASPVAGASTQSVEAAVSSRGRARAILGTMALVILGGSALAWWFWAGRARTSDPAAAHVAAVVIDAREAQLSVEGVAPTPDATVGALTEVQPAPAHQEDPVVIEIDEPVEESQEEAKRPRRHRGKDKANVIRSKRAAEALPKENLAKDSLAKDSLAKDNLAKDNLATENQLREEAIAHANDPGQRDTAPGGGLAGSTPPGTVDAAQVRAVVRAHLGEITTCVSRARMDDRDLKGRVVIRVQLAPTGRVANTAVASSTGATSALEACMRRAVEGWTFSAPAGAVRGVFTYPFAF